MWTGAYGGCSSWSRAWPAVMSQACGRASRLRSRRVGVATSLATGCALSPMAGAAAAEKGGSCGGMTHRWLCGRFADANPANGLDHGQGCQHQGNKTQRSGLQVVSHGEAPVGVLRSMQPRKIPCSGHPSGGRTMSPQNGKSRPSIVGGWACRRLPGVAAVSVFTCKQRPADAVPESSDPVVVWGSCLPADLPGHP